MPANEPTEEPTPDGGEDCASRLRVLAVGTRLDVLRRLMSGPMRVGELQQALEIPQNLLSHHLRVLREAGLVQTTRQGRGVTYSISEGVSVSEAGEILDLGCCKLSFDED